MHFSILPSTVVAVEFLLLVETQNWNWSGGCFPLGVLVVAILVLLLLLLLTVLVLLAVLILCNSQPKDGSQHLFNTEFHAV